MNWLWAVVLPLSVAYAVALQWCVDRWNAPTQYFEHCWLVPGVAAVVIWLRRREWRQQPRQVDRRGLWLLGPALLLHLFGALLMVDSLSATSLVLAVPGTAWLLVGRQRMRGQWPVAWLVLFAVPMPIYVEGRVAFELKELAVGAGHWLANLLGAGIERSGAWLRLQGTDAGLFVADACGGLRSLLAMLTLGYCLAFLLGPPSPRRRVVLLLAAAPIAITANVVRIAVLCLQARWFGVAFAEGTGHTLANGAEWIAAVGLLLLLDAWVTRRWLPGAATGGAAAAATTAAAVPAGSPAPGSLRRIGIGLWIAAVPLLLLSLYRPFAGTRDRAAHLPTELAGFTLVARSDAEEALFQRSLPRWIELLGTSDFVWNRYRAAPGRFVQLVALFHDTNWKSVHPPQMCILGSNMDILVDDLVPAPAFGREVAFGRIVAQSRDDGMRYLTLSVFGTVDWLSGDYEEFVWHHAPRALLRQNNSGFLLRAETAIAADEDLASAEARCGRFLEGLVPAAAELLR